MSVSYFVRYEVRTPDAQAFVEHYRRHHVPLLARWPGIRRVVLHTPVAWSDAWPVTRGTAVLVAQLEFDSAEALQAALGSPERAAARADMAGFPPYDGVVIHQALVSAEAWRSA